VTEPTRTEVERRFDERMGTASADAASSGPSPGEDGHLPAKRVLRASRRRLFFLLGLPAFGLALTSTVVSTYLPVLLQPIAGPAIAGVLIGAEGLVGLVLPPLIGAWSDRTHTRLGPRLPFILAFAVLGAAALVVMPLTLSLLVIGLSLVVFWVSYFGYYTPYYALYPDFVDPGWRGRAIGVQGTCRSVGLLGGMVGGGVMLALWTPLPFVAAAAGLAAITALLYLGLADEARGHTSGSANVSMARAWHLVRDRADIRGLVVANSLWEFAISGLKTFVVLFFTVGLGRSLGFTTAVLATVAVAAVFAAPISGWAADRFGDRRVIETSLWVFALGLLLPFVTLSSWVFPLIAVVAFAAVAMMTLPYSALMGLMRGGDHGVATGLYGLSHGLGTLMGPLVTGVAIQLLGGVPGFTETRGYIALFAVTSVALLISIPVLRRAGLPPGHAGR
jgi:MFS family permease